MKPLTPSERIADAVARADQIALNLLHASINVSENRDHDLASGLALAEDLYELGRNLTTDHKE